MAIRGVTTPAKKIQTSLRRSFFRPLKSSAAAAAASAQPLYLSDHNNGHVDTKPISRSDPAAAGRDDASSSLLGLGGSERLFRGFSTARLLRSSAVLQAAAIESLVDVGMWVMESPLVKVPVARDAVYGVLRHTFYDQFCAGVNHVEVGHTVRRMWWDSGIKTMLVFGVEDVDNDDSCDKNLTGFLNTVESAKSLPPSSTSCVIVKITAICPMPLLRRVSDLLRWEHKDPSTRLPWKLKTFPVLSDSSPLYHTSKRPHPLTPQEEEDLEKANQRLLTLCQRCSEANVPITVDAEYTSVQPAIDYLTYAAAIRYNRDDSPIVFGTIQAYLRDAKERLFLATTAAEKMGLPIGIKLVRGAYMSSETKVATSLGEISPIHRHIQDTHDCFNECASFMLNRIAGAGHRGDSVVLATHNVDSGKLAAAKARELGIEKGSSRLQFAQLYGMSDALSLGLRNAGFVVSKYTPFGPVGDVMPYLLRRAEENRGMLSTSTLDLTLMRKELMWRLKRHFPTPKSGGDGGLQATAKLHSHPAFN